MDKVETKAQAQVLDDKKNDGDIAIISSSDFLQAIHDGRFKDVSQLLKESTACIQAECLAMRDDDGFPALLIASQLGYEAIVKLLLEFNGRGVDVNEEVLPTIDPNMTDKKYRDAQKAYSMYQKVVNVNAPNVQRIRYTALLLASKHGHPRVVELLLVSGAKVNACTGTTALRTASGSLHEECVRILLAHGADVSIPQPQTGGTALLSASMVGHVGIAKMLIEHGAAVNNNARWPQKSSCLMMATHFGHVPMVELLLKHGASPNHVNWGGQTALELAACKGDAGKDLQKLLLANGAKATPGLIVFSALFCGPSTARRLWKHRVWNLPKPSAKESPPSSV